MAQPQCCGRPYPYYGPNAFKLFADSQVFFVTLVSLVLRVGPDERAKDPFQGGRGFITDSVYGDILLLLLLLTVIPVGFALAYRSPKERALVLLQQQLSADEVSLPRRCLSACLRCLGQRDASKMVRKSRNLKLRESLRALSVETTSAPDETRDGVTPASVVIDIDGDETAAQPEQLLTFRGDEPLGLGFSRESEGVPLRVDKLMPNSQAEHMEGLVVGATLQAVQGEPVGERSHSETVAMVKEALESARGASDSSLTLTFTGPGDFSSSAVPGDTGPPLSPAAEGPTPRGPAPYTLTLTPLEDEDAEPVLRASPDDEERLRDGAARDEKDR